MKKLQVKTASGWKYVFCHVQGRLITLSDAEKHKALPSLALYAKADLKWFQSNFGNDEFRLA